MEQGIERKVVSVAKRQEDEIDEAIDELQAGDVPVLGESTACHEQDHNGGSRDQSGASEQAEKEQKTNDCFEPGKHCG